MGEQGKPYGRRMEQIDDVNHVLDIKIPVILPLHTIDGKGPLPISYIEALSKITG